MMPSTGNFKAGKRLRFYAEVRNFGLRDMTWEAFLEDAKSWLITPGFAMRPVRAALVTDEAWLTAVFEIECALIPTLTGAVFAANQKDAALAWLRSEEPGARLWSCPRRIYRSRSWRSLVRSKALGGLGMGLLMAGYSAPNGAEYSAAYCTQSWSQRRCRWG